MADVVIGWFCKVGTLLRRYRTLRSEAVYHIGSGTPEPRKRQHSSIHEVWPRGRFTPEPRGGHRTTC